MKDTPRTSSASTLILVGLGAVIAVLGLLLAAGGMKLAGLGGSWYFLPGTQDFYLRAYDSGNGNGNEIWSR